MEQALENDIFTSFEQGETSSRKKISKSKKIQKMKEKITEHEVLETLIKARYETLSKIFAETNGALKKLALKHVKKEKKMKKVMKLNDKLWKTIRHLKFKIKFLTTKPTNCLELHALDEATGNLNEESSK